MTYIQGEVTAKESNVEEAETKAEQCGCVTLEGSHSSYLQCAANMAVTSVCASGNNNNNKCSVSSANSMIRRS